MRVNYVRIRTAVFWGVAPCNLIVVSEEPHAAIFRVAGCFSRVAVRSLPSIALKMQTAAPSQTLVAAYRTVELFLQSLYLKK
jgi:hypothetical protein